MNLYVGNLSYDTDETELEEAFSAYGEVASVRLIVDRETNRKRGFGFVEMASKGEGLAAIDGMNGQDLAGRTLVVNEARPRAARR